MAGEGMIFYCCPFKGTIIKRNVLMVITYVNNNDYLQYPLCSSAEKTIYKSIMTTNNPSKMNFVLLESRELFFGRATKFSAQW